MSVRKFRKKPIIVEAEQWFIVAKDKVRGNYNLNVGYYRDPTVAGYTKCKHCGKIMQFHGWIDTLEGEHIVCPKDWIIKGIKGEFYPCKPDIFEATYEEVEDGKK